RPRAHLGALHFAHRAGQPGRAGVEAGLAEQAAARLVAEEVWPHRGEAAVHHDHLAGDEERVVAGQEERGVGDVLGQAQVRPRLLLPREAIPRLLAAPHRERGLDHAGRDRVHPDAVRGELGRDRPAQVGHRRLRGGIGVRPRAAADPRDRRGVDDAAAAALRLQARGAVLDPEEHAPHQHREGEVPLLDGGLADRSEGAADARVVEETVETAESLHPEGHQGRHVALRGDVGPERGEPVRAALGLRERHRLGEARVVQVADDHPGALAQEGERAGAADAAPTSGDDGDLAVEPSAHDELRYPRGFTQVSDHASVALLPWRSPRISAHTWPEATLPFTSSWAARAGKNVLKTSIGRSLKPGGALSTNGSMQSYQDIVTRASVAVTVSVAVDQG